MKRYLIGALLCVTLFLAGWLLFSFPYQRHYAERTFEAYTQLQGWTPILSSPLPTGKSIRKILTMLLYTTRRRPSCDISINTFSKRGGDITL